jgi:hypothetical protein
MSDDAAGALRSSDDSLAYARLHSLCSQYDAVLQQHRTMLLTSQSVLLSVATFVGQGHAARGTFPWLAVILFAMGMFVLFVWTRIIIPGGHDVAYCQWQLMLLEAGERDLVGNTFFTDFVKWQRLRGRAKFEQLCCDPRGALLTRGDQTRFLLNYGLPSAFAVCWLALLAYLIVLWATPAVSPAGPT